ncbi:MAG: Re/Si-specific NAD(P)(+) transhydrogenase subunit alpha [Proteobacteria bacterium]|nr:Re/Si-specific NAD(P)(+) transhydrogenase subunit alpha [Pseudomonadota bacterium]
MPSWQEKAGIGASARPDQGPPQRRRAATVKLNVFIPREIASGEQRVAGTPETVRRLLQLGLSVTVESGAGEGAYFTDGAYGGAGAELQGDTAAGYAAADIVLKVRGPLNNPALGRHEAELLKPGAILVSLLLPQDQLDAVRLLATGRVSAFSMYLVPRITRAQKMDALSSQSNIAGYKAVLVAANALPKFFPLLMTAAGTVKSAKVVIMGAGVAGLQAIATAKRLGAQVWATDVRLAVKEQVESLGAKFITVAGAADLQDEGGYAREASPELLAQQREAVGQHVAEADVVITTALVAGKRAPLLIPSELLQRMRPGAVVVDLAAEQGGNCAETLADQTIVRHGVTIIGPTNLPSTLAQHASELYARNVLAFTQPLLDKDGQLALDWQDEILTASAVTHEGGVRHGPTAEALASR